MRVAEVRRGSGVLPAGWWKRARTVALIGLVNVAVMLGLLVPVELVFGTWIRPMRLGDLKRFSIPIDVTWEFDTSSLYEGGPRNPIHYSRDAWGLRGSHSSPADIDVLTIGGSTAEQRYLDDTATWQEVASRELARAGRPLVFANAGVDGQSTAGHLFDFDHWFPLLPGLRPQVMLFYVGTNDVLRHEQRVAFDASMDASSWRVRSVTYQLFRTVRSNLRARDVQVMHGRVSPPLPGEFTDRGLLTPDQRAAAAQAITGSFLANVDLLRARVREYGAIPAFMTQTALGWNADTAPPRGLNRSITVHGLRMNYADVAFLHQHLNRALMDHCRRTGTPCFDLAADVTFEASDYYDYLHNTPRGAERIGRYLAARLLELQLPTRANGR